ncbi:hypothetical protein CSOJ01_13938 [Colletotrichum sojae]|uniref:Uncharacterized protein n=1 Tax=Colletotrichum sojae TaxID=2175907 RepID=A0A8H6MKH1_9PEZI|nr:hypothetical protein CSOJ01_13938 [Colletotrichum sojae]
MVMTNKKRWKGDAGGLIRYVLHRLSGARQGTGSYVIGSAMGRCREQQQLSNSSSAFLQLPPAPALDCTASAHPSPRHPSPSVLPPPPTNPPVLSPAARIRFRFAHLTPVYANSQLFGSTPRLAFLSARLWRRNVFLFFPPTAA